MNNDAKEKLISDYLEKSFEHLRNLIKNLDKNILKHRPFKDAWTIHEHVIHLADGEVNSFVRFRLILSEPEVTLFVWDENKWQKNIDYHSELLEDNIDLIELLRKIECNYLRKIIDKNWESNYVVHAKFGRLNLINWIKMYTEHTYTHADYIKRNLNCK